MICYYPETKLQSDTINNNMTYLLLLLFTNQQKPSVFSADEASKRERCDWKVSILPW